MNASIRAAVAAIEADMSDDLASGIVLAAARAALNRTLDVAVPRLSCRTIVEWRRQVNDLAPVGSPTAPPNVVDLADAARRRRHRQQERAWSFAARSMYNSDILGAIASPERAREHASLVAARPLEETNAEVQRLRADLNDLAAAHCILVDHLRMGARR
jgi:hypothetical protein